MQKISITQITDLHLGASTDETLGGVRTYDGFTAVLKQINQSDRADDLLLLTGDLASNAEPLSYQNLNSKLTSENKRALWLPGNHDSLALMHEHLVDYPFVKLCRLEGWVILMLDSTQAGKPGGKFSQSELDLAAELLESVQTEHILIAMHHAPIQLGSHWLDQQRIENYQLLQKVISKNKNVRAIVTGHVHQEYNGCWGDILTYCTPSSCVQFEKNSHDFALAALPPAYRTIDLMEDGSINTQVNYLQNFNQSVDIDCVGY